MRKEMHVVSNPDRGGWDAKRPNADRASKHFETKKEAMEWSRNLAKREVSVQKCQNAFICGPFAKPANFIFNFLSLKKSSLQTNCHRKQVLVIRPTRLHSLE